MTRLYWWIMRLPCRYYKHTLWYLPSGRVHCYDEGRRVG